MGSGRDRNYDANFLGDGIVAYRSAVKYRDIVDGPSNTVFAGEVTRGQPNYVPLGSTTAEQIENAEPRWAYFDIGRCLSPARDAAGELMGGLSPGGGSTGIVTNPDLTAEAIGCGTPRWKTDRAYTWIWGRESRVLFNGYQPPNSPMVDVIGHGRGWMTARSWHTGGANLVMCDGRVVFVSDSVDANTFTGLFSTNGNELLGAY